MIVPLPGVGDLSNDLSLTETENFKFPCYLSSKEDRRKVFSLKQEKNYGILKLAVSHIIEPRRAERFSSIIDYNVGRYSCYFLGTKNELENIQHFFNTSIYEFIDEMKRNGRYAFIKIPKLNFDKKWSDTELYQYFNLTQEEIDLVESTVK